MDGKYPVYYQTESGKVFKCFVDKTRVEVSESEIEYPAHILKERNVQHIKRCVVQPHVSGKLDATMIEAYHKHGFLDDTEYAYYLECAENERKLDEE